MKLEDFALGISLTVAPSYRHQIPPNNIQTIYTRYIESPTRFSIAPPNLAPHDVTPGKQPSTYHNIRNATRETSYLPILYERLTFIPMEVNIQGAHRANMGR